MNFDFNAIGKMPLDYRKATYVTLALMIYHYLGLCMFANSVPLHNYYFVIALSYCNDQKC